METSVLLQRQMELHGTLRHPPRNKTELENVYKTIRALVGFFAAVRSQAEKLHTPPEVVFQCLMHIGFGDAVNYDKQRREGAVPMHQAKVLPRANAIHLEPRLRAAVPLVEIDTMVSMSKLTRSTLRMKVEDANDFITAERALKQSLEYLCFIDAAAGRDAGRMFAFFMVEDEPSLRTLLHGSATAEELKDATFPPPLPPPARFCDDCTDVARTAAEVSLPAGTRLSALRTLCHWLFTFNEFECIEDFAPRLAGDLAAPLAVCAAEKRSAICRHACVAIATFVDRIPREEFGTAAVRAAIGEWSAVLVRGVFVTVATIAQATDSALRVIVRESNGDEVVLHQILTALESGAQPELRRKALAYLALGVVAAKGSVCAEMPEIAVAAQTYRDVGDSACRRMARALAIAVAHFAGTRATGLDKRAEALMQEEERRLVPLLSDVKAFEGALFGASKARGEDSASASGTRAPVDTRRTVRGPTRSEAPQGLPSGSFVSNEAQTHRLKASGGRPLKLSESLKEQLYTAAPQASALLR